MPTAPNHSPRRPLIDSLEPRQMFASLTPGQTVATSLALNTTKSWTISITAGKNLTLAAADKSNTALSTELSLYKPDGTLLTRSTGSLGSFISTAVPVSGTYTVKLKDVGGDNAGNVAITAFYYASTITDSDDAFTAESGRRRAATIEPGDLDVWTINGKQAQFLSVLATENTANSAVGVGVIVIGPDGKRITGKESEKGVAIDLPALSKTGRYYAVVYEPGANASGRYGISFGQTPGTQYAGDPDTVSALQPGVTRNGDLPGGDLDIWNVSLTAGKKFTARITRTSGLLNPQLMLIGPDGKVRATVNGSSTATLTYTVPTTGTYWLVARDREADNGGRYALKYTLV